jgi:hypothetical protein
MRFLSFTAALSCCLLALSVPAFAQGGHSHDHKGHSHAHDHIHGHGRAKPAVRKTTTPVVATSAPHDHGVETEALFGFVSGSDIGHRGERHLSFFYESHFGKRDGTFRAQQPKVEFGYNPTDWLHVALEFWGDHFKIRNVTDFEDQDRWGAGVAVEFKVQLVKRSPSSPVGVTLVVAPHYGNSEHHTGETARHYALELGLAADTELVKDKFFAALNLLYEPERVRPTGEEEWERESLFGVSGALMAQVVPNVFFGGEVQYFRKYEGFFLNDFHGHALYVGPALTVKMGEHSNFTLAWAAQVAGRAVEDPRRLDLEHFERHRVRARWSMHF